MLKSKNILKPLWVLAIGFLGGLLAALVVNGFSQNSLTSSNAKGATTTSNVSFNNTTDTTKAVKVVQDAVVSVINYQKAASPAISNPYINLFGEENDTSAVQKEDELSIHSEGSGVVYKKEGNTAYLVTNNHVIEGAQRIEILTADGSKIVGELVGADTYSDLAVVKVAADKIKTIAKFADSTKINVGEVAIAIGSPLGTKYANSVTEGIVQV